MKLKIENINLKKLVFEINQFIKLFKFYFFKIIKNII
jgi:hypothetical protein